MDTCEARHVRPGIRAHDGLDLEVKVAGPRRILRSNELRKDDTRQEIVEAGVPRLLDEEMLVDRG